MTSPEDRLDKDGRDKAGRDEAVRDEAGPGEAVRDEAGRDKAGLDKAGRDEAVRDKAGRDKPGRDEDGLDQAVRVRRERREQGRRGGDRSLAQNLAVAGMLGWTIVLPALAGVAVGRWLDHELHGGIVFTSALLFAGLALGCALAWRRMHA